MDKRFFNIYNLTEDEAINILFTPLDQLTEKSDRYIAAAHLVNFNTAKSINALIRVIKDCDQNLYQRITKRKALETLGRLTAKLALPEITLCLNDDDCYIIENAVWSIGEIGTADQEILAKIAQLLEKPGQSYRVIIQTLAKLNYQPALGKIAQFINSNQTLIASAALSAVCCLTGNYSQIDQIIKLLQNSDVNTRRGAIQDLIDAAYYPAIPNIASCAVSPTFRWRAMRLLADRNIAFSPDIEHSFDQAIIDHYNYLNLVHEYDEKPSKEFLFNELYHPDFGRCYLATKTLIEYYGEEDLGEFLITTFHAKDPDDYGAHYHLIKILGWLPYQAGYNFLIEALHNTKPQFQKSRVAAAIALGNLADKRAIPEMKKGLITELWELKYACLIALDKLGDHSGKTIVINDQDWLIKAKANSPNY